MCGGKILKPFGSGCVSESPVGLLFKEQEIVCRVKVVLVVVSVFYAFYGNVSSCNNPPKITLTLPGR